jgi:uncharacterized protein YqgC (DUF456 family)
MTPQPFDFVQLLAYIGMAIGILGTVLPVVPGPLLIWLSTLLWAWNDGFQVVGWPTLILLLLLAMAAEISDVVLAGMGAKKGGASWQSMMVAGIAAVAGLLIFNVVGAIAGAFLGLLGWEARRHGGEWRQAWQTSRSFLLGYLAAIVVKIFFVILMLLLFFWQVRVGV